MSVPSVSVPVRVPIPADLEQVPAAEVRLPSGLVPRPGVRPRVVLDATPLHTAHRFRGIGTYVQHLLEAYMALPEQPDVSLLSVANRPAPAPIAAAVRRPSRPKYRLPNLWPELLYPRALAKAGGDVFHATDPNGLVLHPSAPTVVTLHDLIPLAFRDTYLGPWRKSDIRFAHALYRKRLAHAACVICVSEETRRDCLEHLDVPEDRLAVIPLAGDPGQFFPESPERVAAVKQELSIDRPYVMAVGTLEHHKNIEQLVVAFRLARERLGGEPVLVTVGSWTPATEARFAQLLDEQGLTGWATHLGFVSAGTLRALYTGAAAFAFPSLKEGFGLPVVEALMCGAPVVCSDILSLRGLAGDAAVYVDPTSIESMADGLVSAIIDAEDRRPLGPVRARRFTWEATARATLEVYRSVV